MLSYLFSLGFFVRVMAEGMTYFKPVSSQITISSIVLVLTITFFGLVSSVVGMFFVVVSMLLYNHRERQDWQ
jgi:hypothetical protein